ncbi:hypothetical protein N9L68_07205 [bacterium]|nr:hypothetical protein [bacterium]
MCQWQIPLRLLKYSEEAEEIEPPPEPADEPSQKLADNEGQGSTCHGSLGADAVQVDVYRRARDSLGGWSPDMSIAEVVARKPEDLAVRQLPSGGICNLHCVILAMCRARALYIRDWPNYTMVRRCYTSRWKELRLFRPESTHAMCRTCFELRQAIVDHHCPPAAKMQSAMAWREHLRQQCEDRIIDWAWKFAAREYDCTFLCIAIDACAQAKGTWPRWPKGRLPNLPGLDTIVRPWSVLWAAIAHGWCSDFLQADDDLRHGSQAYMEILLSMFDHVHRIS